MSEEPKVEDLMTKEVAIIDLDIDVKNAASKLAQEGRGCLIVVQDSRVAGIVTEQDIVAKVTASGVDPTKVRIRDIMSTPVITVKSSSTIKEAAELMSAYKIRRLVVISTDGLLSGLIMVDDLARWLAKRSDYNDVALNAIARVKKSPLEPYQ
jgi:CBS domain-containing protein